MNDWQNGTRADYERKGFAGRSGYGKSPVLLVVDFINGFTDPSTPLGGNFAWEINATRQLQEAFRRGKLPIVYTTIAYAPDLRDGGIFVKKVPSLAILQKGSPLVEVDQRIRPAPGERIIEKKYASSFFGTDLDLHLRSHGVDTVIMAGCTTSGCIRASAIDSLQYGYHTIVVREAVGDDIEILVDANTGYTVADVRKVMPGYDDFAVGWLEEPFPAHDYESYHLATSFGSVPLAAGENHYTRFEFNRLIEDGSVTILQPDLSKTGGVTEALRVAHLASAWKLPINPHTSMTGLNMAATIHFLAAIDNGGYFEGDVSKNNLFRDQLVSQPYEVGSDGCVRPLEGAGLGLQVDEKFLLAHPVIEGPAYV
jgi:nicotinamidase-related amidase